ncbi:MAG: helix-turn-helix domain-containing protein [Chitinophagia bacterium]
METSTLINNISARDLNTRFDDIEKQITDLKKSLQPKSVEDYLTRNEAADMLKCDVSTIHNWTKKKKLIAHKIGNRVYYKRSQIESVMIPF